MTHRDDIITVVSGLPRSGTSVMMQMLAAAGMPLQTDNRRAPDSDNPHGYLEDERVKHLARDASWLGEARGKAIKIIAQLLPHVPPGFRYRVIFMERDLDEVLASQQTMIERLGRTGASVPAGRLRQTFADQVRMMKLHIETKGIPVLYTGYRDLMLDPSGGARRVSEFLGGGHDLAAMAAVVDSSLGRHKA